MSLAPAPALPTAVRQSPAPPAPPAPAPTAADVVALQALRCDPSVSILLPTTAGGVMAAQSVTCLIGLVDEAESRVLSEHPVGVAEPLVSALRRLAAEAAEAPARRAVALYASAEVALWFALPVEVRERVVVDPTFATRDLVRSLHRTPLHVLLLLSDDGARLYESTGDIAVPVRQTRFRLRASRFPSTAAYLRTVDTALAAHVRSRPAPVVVAGNRALAEQFTARSRATTRFAGVVDHDPAVEELSLLISRVRPVLERYLRSREQESLTALARTPSALVASGVDAVWLATRSERPEMLVVEEDFFFPARLGDDADLLLPADDPTAPGVIDDVIDDVIEAVLRAGGWVALAAPGALPEHGGIAMTVRDR